MMNHQRVIVSHYGGPETLELLEEEIPDPKSGEVRVKVLTAGVGMPDIMAREGIHPETPPVPFTPGWDLVGRVDRLGKGVSGFEVGQLVAAMPIHGAYAQYICLPQKELVPVASGLDPSKVVSLILNYITAHQMLHRSAKVKPGQQVLVHGAAGGVGTALLQLGRVSGLKMYGTCSLKNAPAVSELGAVPIDYRTDDYVKEVHRLTGEGVDVVFDPFAGTHLWHSRDALRPGGKVVGYGTTTTLRAEGLGTKRSGRRNRWHGMPRFALYIFGSWILPGQKHLIPYSIQTLKRLRPAFFRQDLNALLELFAQKKIDPLVARPFPLAEVRQAHELLAKGGVVGKIVLTCND